MPKIFETQKSEFAEHVLSLEEFRLFSDMKNLVFTEEAKNSILSIAEEYSSMEYEPILAHSYMRYEKNGNRSIYEGEYFNRRRMVWHLFLGEYIERKGRFLEKLIDGIWLILDECSWVIPAHTKIRIDYVPKLPLQYKHEVDIVDLFSAETGAMLSLVGYLGKNFLNEVTPIICDRIFYEVRRRVILPYLNYNDFWWMGYVRKNINNWCPWISSNVLISCALLEPDMETRKNITRKAMEVIDHFTRNYHNDGGCDEGPNYWTVAGASYFDCLEILYDITGGYADVFDNPFIRSMGEYIAKFCIDSDENYYINFADSGPRVNINKNLIVRFGRRTHSDVLWQFGLNCKKAPTNVQMQYNLYRSLKNLYEENLLSESGSYQYPKKVWFGGIQVMIARESEKNSEGLFFAMKGGHNRESHNHNDVGQFVVYDNGKPLIIDVGVGTYCADTFNENRYKIWTMRSCYHNLPSFGDIDQKYGFEHHSEDVMYDEEHNKLSMELKRAYPEESSLIRFVRTGELNHGAITITDDIELKEQKKTTFHFMLADQPRVKNGYIQLNDQRKLYFDEKMLSAAVEEIQIEDPAIRKNWNREVVYRVLLTTDKTKKYKFEFIIQ